MLTVILYFTVSHRGSISSLRRPVFRFFRCFPACRKSRRDGTAMHKFRQPNTLRFRLRLWPVTCLPSAFPGSGAHRCATPQAPARRDGTLPSAHPARTLNAKCKVKNFQLSILNFQFVGNSLNIPSGMRANSSRCTHRRGQRRAGAYRRECAGGVEPG